VLCIADRVRVVAVDFPVYDGPRACGRDEPGDGPVTCAVAVRHANRVYMGVDSISINTDSMEITIRRDQKLFRTGDFLFAWAGSMRTGQLLRYAFFPPKVSAGVDLHEYMCTDFIQALRQTLRKGGVLKVEDEIETSDADLLVSVGGRIFIIEADFQVNESLEHFASIGHGAHLALGALHATHDYPDPEDRVVRALSAAEHASAAVRGPWVLLDSAGREPRTLAVAPRQAPASPAVKRPAKRRSAKTTAKRAKRR
jgi:ATP-dependent protease HslVU (ClpYQ) peptidase subunit